MRFIERYNQRAAAPGARHEGTRPSSTRRPPRPYRGLEELDVSRSTTATVTVTHCGRICFEGAEDQSAARSSPARRSASSRSASSIWLVTFMHYDLGYFDDETCRLEPIENPFGPKVLPMSPE